MLRIARRFQLGAIVRPTIRTLASSNLDMACYQCEQTAETGKGFGVNGRGCTTVGNCGKSATVSREQDLVMHALKGISQFTARAAKLGATDTAVDAFSLDAIFATLTNVNFSEERFVEYLKEADKMIVRARTLYESACKAKKVTPEKLSGPALWRLKTDNAADMAAEAKLAGDIATRKAEHGEDVVGMQGLQLLLKTFSSPQSHRLQLQR